MKRHEKECLKQPLKLERMNAEQTKISHHVFTFEFLQLSTHDSRQLRHYNLINSNFTKRNPHEETKNKQNLSCRIQLTLKLRELGLQTHLLVPRKRTLVLHIRQSLAKRRIRRSRCKLLSSQPRSIQMSLLQLTAKS